MSKEKKTIVDVVSINAFSGFNKKRGAIKCILLSSKVALSFAVKLSRPDNRDIKLKFR